MVNFGALTAAISWHVWAPPQISTGFASWIHYFRSLINSVEQRAPYTFSWAAIALGIDPHSSFILLLIMAALCNRAGHYIFALWFLSSSSSSFSSPNLSSHRLDLYHTSSHGVALVRI